MVKLKNKFAIGCIVQWYEIEMVEEYLQSLKNALDAIDNKNDIEIILDEDFYDKHLKEIKRKHRSTKLGNINTF